ncbi:hypothetical protein [Bacteriophage sp.]|nr:hypothetical protein [Bacteriophage sp.]
MQEIDPLFLEELQKTDRPMVELWEFFTSEESDYSPANAVLRVSTVPFTFDGQTYTRRVLSRGDARRYFSKQANTCSVTLDNTDLFMSDFIAARRLEGMWAQCRIPSLKVASESLIIFGGFCDKPGDNPGVVTVRQDIPGGDEDFPPKRLTQTCLLVSDFKGHECRGGEALSAKSAEYQAAVECDGSTNQCSFYGNLENRQAVQFVTIEGTFAFESVTPSTSFLGRLFGRKKKRTVSAVWSAQADSAEKIVPVIGGRMQVEATPLIHADTGARIRSLQMLGMGPVKAIYQVKNRSKEYPVGIDAATLQEGLGLLGSEGEADSVLFPGAGKFSGIAKVECEVIGSDPTDANDSSPTISAIVDGLLYEVPDEAGTFTADNRDWTDCGPWMVRHHLLREGRFPRWLFDDMSAVEAAKDCFAPIIDETGFAQFVTTNNVTAGTDFVTWAVANGYGADTARKILLLKAQGKVLTGGYAALYAAYTQYIQINSIPETIAPIRAVQSRYATNFAVAESGKLRDFIHDLLLTSFNGQLLFNGKGKLSIRVDKPVPNSYTTAATDTGDLEIPVENAEQWRARVGKLLLVGAHTANAEVVKVKGWRYASYSPAIALEASATGTITATASASTLGGGSDYTPDQASVEIGGTVSAGATISLEIDGITINYTLAAGDDIDAIAGYLTALVNAHPTLRRYLTADWDLTTGSTFYLRTKIGKVKIEKALTKPHGLGVEVMEIVAAYGGTSEYDQKMRDKSFEFPLGSRISSYNRVTGKFFSTTHDWQEIAIERNDVTHQRLTRRVNTLELNLGGVNSAHQAWRICETTLGKNRKCDWFCKFQAGRDSLLLDVGDVIAVSHWTGNGKISYRPVTILDSQILKDQDAQIVAQLYRSDVYRDDVPRITPPIYTPLIDSATANTNVEPPNQGGESGGSSGSGLGNKDPYTDYVSF